MVHGDVGTFDTRFERLTDHYRDAIARGDLKPGDRFPSARELSEMHGVGRTTAGRVHGTLISLGLIEHRPGIGTFVLGPRPGGGKESPALKAAARKALKAFDEWRARTKPQVLIDAMNELRDALRLPAALSGAANPASVDDPLHVRPPVGSQLTRDGLAHEFALCVG
jgi:DNA-binding transcriptional regulator YhcF (GntR family)